MSTVSRVSFRGTFGQSYAFVVVRRTIKAQTVALNAPSTGFAVLMVVTLADDVAEAADAVDVAIDCAAAETANTAGVIEFKRMTTRKLRCTVYARKQTPHKAGIQVHFILSPKC